MTVTHCDNAGAAVFHCNPATNQVAGVSYDANGSQLNGGNLLSKSPSGGAPTLSQSVNTATNQIVGQSYDGNGNQTSSPLGTLAYDAENRVASASGGVQYAYDSRNKRVWRSILSGGNLAQQVYVYGVDGQKIGTYTFTLGQYGETNIPEMTNSTVLLATFFGHKRVGVYDRLGSAKYNQSNNQAQSFYPYGEDRGTVEPNDELKFATYTRDAATGLDYADQRYYASNFGRFMSPDPAGAGAADVRNPTTWSMYTYANTDPLNYYDPDGLDTTCADTSFAYAGTPLGITQDALDDEGQSVTDLAETMYTESGQGPSSNSTQEEAEIGAVIMNRWLLVNGYWYLYPYAGSGPLSVSPYWGTPGGIANIVQAPSQFVVWSGGSLTSSAQSNLNAVLNSSPDSKTCQDLQVAIGAAIEYASLPVTQVYTDIALNTGLVLLAFNSNPAKNPVPSWMQEVGSFGDKNVFFGAPFSDFSQTLRPLPKPPRRPHRPHSPRHGGAILVQ